MQDVIHYIDQYPQMSNLLLFLSSIVLAGIAYYLVKYVFLKYLNELALKTKVQWDDILVKHGVFSTLALIAPAIVFYLFLDRFPSYVGIIRRILHGYLIVIGILFISRFISAIVEIYEGYPVASKRPIRGISQLINLFVLVIGVILTAAVLMEKSPWGLLSGLGAITGILMLIFKDTILAFIASIQIAAHNLIRKGDWVEMPAYGVDGDVIDIALHNVTIQNFDKTIVTIPTSKFVEGSFKNWRGMKEAGGRRIKRSILIDQTSIRFLNDEAIHRLEQIDLIKEYIIRKKKEINRYKMQNPSHLQHILNRHRINNLGCFRAYVTAYLQTLQNLRTDMTFLVRYLSPTPQGLPLELYVFTNETDWTHYENIQADIIDHLLSAIPLFDLRIFQYPSAHSFSKMQVLLPPTNPQKSI